MGRIEARLAELGIGLPEAAAPLANYVPFVVSGNTVTISGQLPLGPGGALDPGHLGLVGGGVAVESATAAARLCALNVVAQLRAAIGDLDRVRRCVRLGGFIASAPGFTDQAAAMNGASDLVVEIFGEAGRHARSTIGVAGLPKGAAVEVEALFEVEPAAGMPTAQPAG